MAKRTLRNSSAAALAGFAWLALSHSGAFGAQLDKSGEVRLSVRTYTAARVGTQDADVDLTRLNPNNESSRIIQRTGTFPESSRGHLRQSRGFTEIEFTHKLDRLVNDGFGPFRLLKQLPFKIRDIEYKLSYRGEYEGVYDYGPSEYRNSDQFFNTDLVARNIVTGNTIDVLKARRHLRRVATDRHRLFQAYVQGKAPVWPTGTLQLRFGRQIVAWGETDVFRLLDNINPLDSSFGGFLVPLDERRVPLDMLLADYYYGAIDDTPFSEIDLQLFAAIDKASSIYPGIPAGSPWSPPNLGAPSSSVVTQVARPARSWRDIRGGGRLSFTAAIPGIRSADFSIAHYYTYLDLPGVQLYTSPEFPTPIGNQVGQDPSTLVLAVQSAPLVQISGASTTFLIPLEWVRPLYITGEPTVRAEVAYFSGEARYKQSQLDPFSFGLPQANPDGTIQSCPRGRITANGLCTGGLRTGDSFNFVLGFDLQQWIRWLNPSNTFFFSTQFFYKHLNDTVSNRLIKTAAPPAGQWCDGDPTKPFCGPIRDSDPSKTDQGPLDGEVLPVPERYVAADWWRLPTDAAEPLFVRNPTNQYMNTFLVATNYYSGRVIPSVGMIYDWAGAFVFQPQITLLRDPWRLSMSYSFLTASRLRGGNGVSLLRDRDNVLFQLEYAL